MLSLSHTDLFAHRNIVEIPRWAFLGATIIGAEGTRATESQWYISEAVFASYSDFCDVFVGC